MPGFFDNAELHISEDKTRAYLTVTDPQTIPSEFILSADGLREWLRSEHELIAINEELLADIVVRFNTTRGPILDEEIANTGQLVEHGEDARIEWLVDDESDLVEDDKGRVNFYSFSTLKNVVDDQAIAVFHPVKPGKDGLSVTGEPIEAKEGKEAEYVPGENVRYVESERTFYAEKAGRVELRGNVVCVSRLFEVEGDLDFSVGNVNFDGFVRVKGDVSDNFQIHATDGVQIDGILQAAHIMCGGSVSVIGGINCRGKGSVKTDADVATKFINNADINARGTLKSENEIVNCNVQAGAVHVPEGNIAGGNIVCSGNIIVAEAGSDMAVRTVIHAGYDLFMEHQAEEIKKELKTREQLLKRLDNKMNALKSVNDDLREDKRDAVTAMEMRIGELRNNVAKLEAEYEEKKKAIYNQGAEVEILKKVYPGVIIRIGKYEKSIGQAFDGYRRWAFDKNKYEVVPYFEPKGAVAKKK